MAMRLTVLASGSGGNATLIEADGFGLLLDAGLGPRQLADRLAASGCGWESVGGLLLTHTHGDHWNEATFNLLHQRQVPVYCHAAHAADLRRASAAFGDLERARLVRLYEAGEVVVPAPGLRCRPLPVRHDSGATFGFRIEGRTDLLFGDPPAVAYLADLGTWDEALVEAVGEVDVLALEFNHDEDLERGSGRQARLIARVLGDEGHLSNAQAAAMMVAVLRRSAPGRLRHVVQLHLSRQCNRPGLAAAAARAALVGQPFAPEVVTAHQDRPLPPLPVSGAAEKKRRVVRRNGPRLTSRQAVFVHPWLPGMTE